MLGLASESLPCDAWMVLIPENMSQRLVCPGIKTTMDSRSLFCTYHRPRLLSEDVFWARQDGPTDPKAAMANHLVINRPPDDHHLFSYEQKKGDKIVRQPLTKAKFLERVKKAALAASA